MLCAFPRASDFGSGKHKQGADWAVSRSTAGRVYVPHCTGVAGTRRGTGTFLILMGHHVRSCFFGGGGQRCKVC